ncbi:hypothetical protein E3N88_09749 [Mikania micrantha]|uniref:Reverse transcriptase Ty1/copia-type domain-containing protein n=1 Tax=Mikania micrantha TaxID=192012 RepID=A0A5N6PM92_9ASTR|nr:hypothetical protein E3N88_09749 [Mikania micrantha]
MKEALKSIQWVKAMEDELLSLESHKTWTLTELPSDKQAIVYVSQPPGFEIKGKEDKHGYERSENEPTVYVKRVNEKELIIICLYEDDIIYTGSSNELIDEFKQHMLKEFDMTDIGILNYFLGLEVIKGKEGIFLSQKKYAKDLLNRFGMIKCKTVTVPMIPGEKLQLDDGVGIVSLFLQQPSIYHLGAAKRILRYIAGTIEYGIWYGNKQQIILTGYSDNDWAGSSSDMKSISAHVFSIGSGSVSWSSRKQGVVALSTTEAEYISAAACACQAIWLRKMMGDLMHEQQLATTIFCDNRSAIFLNKNQGFHSRTKHISIKYHFIRTLTDEGQVKLNSVATHEQIADILTKALGAEQFLYLRERLGVTTI